MNNYPYPYNPNYAAQQPQFTQQTPNYGFNPFQSQSPPLHGRFVTSRAEVEAVPPSMDGTVSYFPSLDGKEIYGKYIDGTGKSNIVTYVPQQTEPQAAPDMGEQIQQLSAKIDMIYAAMTGGGNNGHTEHAEQSERAKQSDRA